MKSHYHNAIFEEGEKIMEDVPEYLEALEDA